MRSTLTAIILSLTLAACGDDALPEPDTSGSSDSSTSRAPDLLDSTASLPKECAPGANCVELDCGAVMDCIRPDPFAPPFCAVQCEKDSDCLYGGYCGGRYCQDGNGTPQGVCL